MKPETFAKIFSIGQIVLGVGLVICATIMVTVHVFLREGPIFVKACLLVMWYIAYKMLGWSIAEYQKESTYNNTNTKEIRK